MRLTHIKLAGFKSFTDPTTIHVPGRLVAVIGPNGCGKSNVIDAVRWVLGEASAKQLRGESMQDVIFNGAATRRPAPRASVELVFDNSDHSLQGAWGQYAEVSIKRQLTRQGESTYFINNQVVRRRDITDLFLGTGVGARGYAVIEQGMISRIIEARPEELRAYIEEAAGVSKYKERRKETEGRLKDTREHLQRLADLQSELARQVEKLEKQAETAERYRRYTEQLSQQQDLLDYIQWQQALAQADQATAQYHTLQQRQDEAAGRQQILAEQINALRETEQEQQQYAHDLGNQRALLREQSARLEEQLRSQHNLQQRLERDKLAAQAALQRLQQEQQAVRDALADTGAEQENQQAVLAELAVQTAECEERLPELEDAQAAAQAAFQSQQDELNRIRRELALKQQQTVHAADNTRRQQERSARLQAELAALNLPDEAELAEAAETAERLRQQQQQYEAELGGYEAETGRLKAALQAAEDERQHIERRLIAARAQRQALAELLQEGTEQGEYWPPEQPALWQHIRAPQEWQHALGVVLAGRLHARAADSGFIPPHPLPDGAAWFDRHASSGRKTQPANALIHQIQADAPFQTALQHWLDGALCAPDLEYALSRQSALEGRQYWLTPEGHQIDRIGVLLYRATDADNLIARQARHDELGAEIDEWTPKLAEAERECERWREQLAAQEAAGRQRQTEQRLQAAELQEAQTRATELLARTNQGQLRREHILLELAQLEEEQTVGRHASDGLQDDIAVLEEAAAALAQRHLDADEQHRQRQQQLKQAQLALLEANRQYGLAEVAAHKLQQRRHSLQDQLQSLEQQALDWQERQSELALAYESESRDDEQRIRLETLSEQILTLDEQIAAAQARLQDTQQQGRTLYEQQQTLSVQLPQLQAATQTALLQQQEALLNAKRFHQNLSERQADLTALAEAAGQGDDLKRLSDGIGTLAQKIQALGAVNLAALQELEEARERDGYYRSQSEDVLSAIALLEEAIAQIDGETKSRFKETFDAVNAKVQTFFPTLFGGGEAVLQMTGDDLLTAGVSIMARPPGKKNSTIHLLSGGEKALTAMSLVFALFSLNPAPFCLLDEVDAPLDDANAGRFCNLVKEMSAQTQFLYISHKRLTMEMAEQLIGVTMQEKGVSRIVAVDIKEALDMAESGAA